jgi:SAM-dependent methyltransferase
VRFWFWISRQPDREARNAAEQSLAEFNREFYDGLWSGARLVPAERFNTWGIVQELSARGPARLEIGPGLRPRLPLRGTDFVDLSEAAVRALRRGGARATVGTVAALPVGDASYDFVCALDIVEHVEDDSAALREIARVLRPGGRIGISDVVSEDHLTPADRAERGSYVGCIAGALSVSEYRDGLVAAGLTDVEVELTHSVADGMHGAIVRAYKPR